MRQIYLFAHGVLCFLLFATSANALDVARFKALASQTVQDLNSGNPDIGVLIARQEELIVIGVDGCRDLAAIDPAASPVMRLVVDGAEGMKHMDLDEIEEAWHDGGVLDEHGIDFDDLDHFGPVVSHMDAVVHPATAYLLLKQYQRDGNRAHLRQVKEELSEVIKHIGHL